MVTLKSFVYLALLSTHKFPEHGARTISNLQKIKYLPCKENLYFCNQDGIWVKVSSKVRSDIWCEVLQKFWLKPAFGVNLIISYFIISNSLKILPILAALSAQRFKPATFWPTSSCSPLSLVGLACLRVAHILDTWQKANTYCKDNHKRGN